MPGDVKKQVEIFNRLNETNRKFTTTTTVNILNDSQLMNIHEQHDWQQYELFRRYEQLLPNEIISPIKTQLSSSSALSLDSINTPLNLNHNHQLQLTPSEDNAMSDINKDLRTLIVERVPNLSILDGEPMKFLNGAKFYCTINDILTSDGEFWVEREFSSENEQKFHQFIDILSLFATSYESLTEVYVGQLVALYYESSWHRALVVSKSDEITITKQPSARVRLVDYGSSLYVHVSQLKWLPEQFYLFPFKALECLFSEAVKPTFSDTVRLTFKQLVLHKRLRATVYDRDGSRLCVLLKCRTEEGMINVYRYLRAHEHKSNGSRILDDGDIVQCLQNTIFSNSTSLDQSTLSNSSMNLTIPILSPPSPIKFTHEQIKIKRMEIKKIFQDENDHCMNRDDAQDNSSMNAVKDNKKVPSSSSQSTPYSYDTIISPLSRLSFTEP